MRVDNTLSTARVRYAIGTANRSPRCRLSGLANGGAFAATGVILQFLDFAGTAVFAVSGAIVAARRRQTLVTFAFFAIVTAVGGGTVRDLLIGAPVFWIREDLTLLICLAAAIVLWLLPGGLWRGQALLWFDAAGVAAYATVGAAKGLSFGLAPLPAVAMGVLTACFGGITRDTLAGQPSILMRSEIYVTAAAVSAGLMVVVVLLGFEGALAGTFAALIGFAVRGGAICRGWALPRYRR